MKERMLGVIGEELLHILNATGGTTDWGPDIQKKAVTTATRWKHGHLTTTVAVKRLRRLCAKAMREDARENGEVR